MILNISVPSAIKQTVEKFISGDVEWEEVIKSMVFSSEIPEPDLLEITESSSLPASQSSSLNLMKVLLIYFTLNFARIKVLEEQKLNSQ
jgi:hypothetical protein